MQENSEDLARLLVRTAIRSQDTSLTRTQTLENGKTLTEAKVYAPVMSLHFEVISVGLLGRNSLRCFLLGGTLFVIFYYALYLSRFTTVVW